MENPNGTETRYTYYPTNRVESITHRKTVEETEISSFSYEYDKNGNNLIKISSQNAELETTVFGYDPLDRLLDFTVFSPGKTEKTEYTYHMYNRKTERVSENEIIVKDRIYYYDKTNWLTLYKYKSLGHLTG